jgi:hypothetical protein
MSIATTVAELKVSLGLTHMRQHRSIQAARVQGAYQTH